MEDTDRNRWPSCDTEGSSEMAHGIYAFLIRIDDPNVDDEALAKEAESLFVDGFNDRLDEDNGYQEECLVLRNGRIVNLSPTDDSLYREVARLPQDERYNWARLIALQCVANEFELGGRCPLLVYEE